ncbi:MAG: D-hexose-6-phosphate mutarotase [Phycisphaerales bacterium]|nr:D-hexose-6-phosphate mutarotase [Phycisphaerales bacterium]
MSDLQDLQRFAIPGIVTIEARAGGLIRFTIKAREGEAHVYPHGAHVTHFQPAGAKPVLFLSGKSHFAKGKAIRGGVPVIFPWFGAKEGDAAAPAHGFARVLDWRPTDVREVPDGTVSITMELASSAETRKVWPNDFRMRYTITVGRALDLSLEVQNVSGEAFRFEEALHTYLAVSDVRNVEIVGLDGKAYLDKVDAARRKVQPPGGIRIEGETDRVYLDTADAVTVTDPGLGRRLIIQKQGSRATVLWNPWIAKAKSMSDFGDDEWPKMLCVESANVSDNAVTLAAGATHEMRATITAEA